MDTVAEMSRLVVAAAAVHAASWDKGTGRYGGHYTKTWYEAVEEVCPEGHPLHYFVCFSLSGEFVDICQQYLKDNT